MRYAEARMLKQKMFAPIYYLWSNKVSVPLSFYKCNFCNICEVGVIAFCGNVSLVMTVF